MKKIFFYCGIVPMSGGKTYKPVCLTNLDSICLIPETLKFQIDALIILIAVKIKAALWQEISHNIGAGKENDINVSLIFRSDDSRFRFERKISKKFSRADFDRLQENYSSMSPEISLILDRLRKELSYFVIGHEKFKALSVAHTTDAGNSEGR